MFMLMVKDCVFNITEIKVSLSLSLLETPSEMEKTAVDSFSSKTSIRTTITEVTSFQGIRKDVTASELLQSKIIDENTFKDLSAGKLTVAEISEKDSVRKYLEGTNSIAGVYLQATKETLSIQEAKSRGLLTPGTSLVLLEAQAATGFVIDPVKNKKLSVEEAVAQGVVGKEWKNKLLSAERAVTGYKDPYTGDTVSLFQALKKDLIVKDHGIRLLEAQIATGGIIDPVYSHRVPVQVAYERGYFDEEMNQILSDPDDDTKGFFDPNTQENLTYLQLIERCTTDPVTGLSLLVIVKKGEFYFFVDEATKLILKSTTTTKAGGKYRGTTVSLWDLLYSKYITEEKRRELVQQYKTGTITIKQFMDSVLKIVEEQTASQMEKTAVTTFQGIRKDVTASELLQSKIIDENTFKDLSAGKLTVAEISEKDSVRKYLEGTNSIAGVYLQATKETLSIQEAKSRGLLTPGTSLVLLEAQAATGFVIDPVKNKKLSVEEAVAQGVVGKEWKNKLLSAERAVTGYKDPYTGDTISLFQALKKDLIVKDHGIRLLEAQIATGGIIDPVYSHRVPVQVAYERGYFDEEMNQILSDPDDDTKGFFDPNTQENLTYLQLIERCTTDPVTGLSLLVIVKKGEFYFFVDEATKLILKSTTTTKAGGKYRGTTVSLWDLLYSKYITEEKRRELVQQYKTGTITIKQFMDSVLKIVEEQTASQMEKTGIRKDVTASELLQSKIIDENTFKDLSAGKLTVAEISEKDSVRKYLEGTNSIAGVYLQATKETLSIQEAKSRGLLTPGTSLVLLEAQAATGFVIDPVKNKKLSVEEAVAQGVVGKEWKNKLLSAERAVTGYKDPYTGDTISLFQALKKDLIVKDHGIRLLEAQIATGGIIDPVYSHRVPVQVAYERGYFDEEMNQILSDPDDDTKGFFDPNTQENLTYLQLIERCTTDPVTGLSLLVIVKKGEFYFFVDEATKLILKSTTTTKAGGKYRGTTVSLWDLLYSKYITEEKRRELVQQTTITEVTTFQGIRKDVTASELLQSKIIDENTFKDLSAGKLTVAEISEKDSVRKYLEGTNSIAGVYLQATKETLSIQEAKSRGLLTPGTSLVLLEAQAATGFVIDPVKNKKLSVEEAVAQGVVGNEWKNKLLSAERAVTGYKDPYTGDTISLFQALKKDLIVKDHGIRLLEAQIATGGIIDPVYSHRVPVQVAYERGYFDEEMNQILSDPDDDTKGFFDPNTQENLTYLQLIERCTTDPVTGLSLLVIVKKGEFYFFVDEATKLILKSTTTTKAGGKYRGTTVSLWDLLYSKYITEEKRRELVQQYKTGTITIKQFMDSVLKIVTTFQGIRKDVTASELLQSKIIDENTFKDLSAGKLTVAEISEKDSVRKYLEGTNSIAGVYLQATKETLSIQEAKSRGLLTPGTSLVLLEAQAATGFVIDPVKNKKLSVEEAVAQGVVGNEWKNKLLSAERAVTGYKDPYTGDTISLFQALKKDLIVKDHGIRLLEAQIATGGIIDPVYSHRVPVQVAYERGYFDEEMNQILSDPDDDTKGFFDPNTQENLTYLQLIERCTTDPVTGLSLLVIVKKGEFYFFVDEATKLILKSTTTTKAGGKYRGTTVSLWDLLYSKYITEEKRRELVQQYKTGTITIKQFMDSVLKIVEEQTASQMEKTAVDSSSSNTSIRTTITEVTTFQGIRKDVTASELLQSKIIDENTFKDLSAGKLTVAEISEKDSVRKYLEGTNSIAGVYLQATKETLSIQEAKSRGLLTPGTSLVLLEAQAATGFVIDPVKNKKLSVEEAVAQGVVGNEWKNKLLSAERAVTGYKDPYTGDTISLFQALKKDLIVKDHGIRLLEAQIATGGIIDPVYSHRVPVQVAYERGYFDEEMNQILSDPDDDTKGFFDPNTQENLTYLQLIERCTTDPVTGLSLLVIVKKGEFYFFVDEATKLILKSTTTTKAGGKYRGTTVSLWDLLYSKYITEEKRRELVQQYKTGTITIKQFMDSVLKIVEEQTACQMEKTAVDSSSSNTSIRTTITEVTTFQGIRKDVTASELLQSKIIDENTFKDLSAGKLTVAEISEKDSVRKYLEGTNSIAGVYLQATKETLSIQEAKSRGLLTPGTSLVLLEAQAATGFVIDPVKNKKLSVEEAVAQGVVGNEWKNKLLSAERAVTGYKDPYTGDTISLFQALKKDLIVKDHGIRLLEAQIATGGIIDPVYSHRVPVQVAYQRGYFDEEMNQILSDPDDDTKGFFDPNTQENLTYLQLIERCTTDPVTGLSLLVIVKKGEFYFFVDEATKLILKSTTTTKAGGKYRGTTVSLWDLLYSKYITEEKRRELVQQYKTGTITIKQFMDSVLKIVEEQTASQMEKTAVDSSSSNTSIRTTITEVTTFQGIRKDVTASELLQSKIIDENTFKDLSAGKLTVAEISEKDSVRKYLEGTNSIAGVYLQATKETLSIQEAKSRGLLTPGTSLVLLEAQAATGFVIDPVKNKKLSVEEAVAQGVVGNEWKNKLLSAERAVTGYKDPNTGDTISLFQLILKSTTTTKAGGKYRGTTVSLWDLLYSKYITEEKRRELVQQYKTGTITIKQFMDSVLKIVEEQTASQMEKTAVDSSSSNTSIRTTITEVTTFQGIRKDVTASELLQSKIIDENTFKDLSAGKLTVAEISEKDSVRKYLEGTNSIAGVYLQATKETLSIQEAKSRGLLTPGTSLVLLEAQAATGFVIDPVKNKKLSVEEAVAQGVVGNEWKNKLLSAERAVTGYKDPYTGDTISLFQALKKDLIVKDHGIRLLEAQIATGGIIDPVYSHRVPVQVAYQRGYFDEEMNQILSDPDDDTKGFFDPNTQENLTYLQLIERCTTDPVTGLSLLVIVKKGEFYFFVDEATKLILKSTTTTKAGGKYRGTTVSLWDLLYSKYITEEKRRELVQQYKTGTITIKQFMDSVLKIVEEQTASQMEKTAVDSSSSNTSIRTTITEVTTFQGIRKDVTASELLQSKIIDENTFKDLSAGKLTVAEISEKDSVRKYLEGTNSIAGVYLQATKETLSIQEAKSRGLLKPGTSLVLLEAQAATGFVIDPVKNKKLSVEEAVAQGVVGKEWKNKLLSAERAVTGYKDPYTGDTISLFQALKKDFIVKDHGIRLLEAQIATGGIIDPVYSHRVPVQVAYERGYFDEEMNQILSDPDDDTKGFFDPNTKENLTYLQLIERCTTDPVTGLSLLVIVKKGEFYFFVDEATKLILKSTTTTKAGGKYRGTTVSLWDLLYSKYITEEKRRELVQQYKTGTITIKQFMDSVLNIVEEQTASQMDIKVTHSGHIYPQNSYFQTIKDMVSQRYEEEKEKTKKDLQSAVAVTLTADMWTSMNMEAYLAVTGHYVDKESHELHSSVLAVQHVPQNTLQKTLPRLIGASWRSGA
uniref:Epiplakin 1 n=1 Tax=Oryzias latipes TaxID=8090 RepID=A0A3P9H4T3_ORYLA